jgi:hypothetical protein
MANLRISACKKWNEDLKRNFNLFAKKTYRLPPPNLASDYLSCCYLIGLWDGDGTISLCRKTQQPQIRYGSASREIVQWVKEFVDAKFPFRVRDKAPGNVISKPDNSYHSLAIYGIRSIKIIDFFRRIDVPKFDRKWNNPEILTIIENYRRDFPEFFTPDQELTFDSAGSIVFANADSRFSTLSSKLSPFPV